jgi:hypothetical protein
MLIFYAWVVFLAAIILSVPVVYLIESKKNKKAQEPVAPTGDEIGEPELSDELGGEPSDEIPDDLDGFGQEMPSGEDDFSAFEQEFK